MTSPASGAGEARALALGTLVGRGSWAALLESLPVPSALLASDGRLLAVNEALCVFTRRSRASLLGSTIDAITHPEDREAGWLERATAPGAGLSCFGRGSCLGSGDCLTDGRDRRPTGALETWLPDPRSDRDDPAGSAALGAVAGGAEAEVGLARTGLAGARRVRRRCLTPAGDVLHVELVLSRPVAVGAEQLLLCQFLDRGERKRAEEIHREMLDRERDLVAALQELDRVKTTFVATVSHELRTPLTNALGYLELLADGLAGPLSERQHAMVAVIQTSSSRLLRLIEDLLVLSEMENSRLLGISGEVSVPEVVAEVLAGVSPAAEQGGVELVSRLDPDCGVLLGDRTHLERALAHVVGNAVKFTPAGGTVTLSARPSRGVPGADPSESAAEPRTVVVEVSDTGVGIAQEEQTRLFERFSRATASFEHAVPGTGLGLALAAELVEAHGGVISLTSELAVGTTVTVTLPAGYRCEECLEPEGPSNATEDHAC